MPGRWPVGPAVTAAPVVVAVTVVPALVVPGLRASAAPAAPGPPGADPPAPAAIPAAAAGLAATAATGAPASEPPQLAATVVPAATAGDTATPFTTDTTANSGLGSNNVPAVYADGGTVYAATYGGMGISTELRRPHHRRRAGQHHRDGRLRRRGHGVRRNRWVREYLDRRRDDLHRLRQRQGHGRSAHDTRLSSSNTADSGVNVWDNSHWKCMS